LLDSIPFRVTEIQIYSLDYFLYVHVMKTSQCHKPILYSLVAQTISDGKGVITENKTALLFNVEYSSMQSCKAFVMDVLYLYQGNIGISIQTEVNPPLLVMITLSEKLMSSSFGEISS
jgi:hypothetical protein